MAGSLARRALVGALPLLLLAAPLPAQPRYAVGSKAMTVPHPGLASIPVTVWFPVSLAGNAAEQARKPAPGRRRLIVLSHGSGGALDNHGDTVRALVSAGLLVATPLHPYDNRKDMTGAGSDLQLLGRPQQVVHVLDAILADPLLAPVIDPARIGFIGYSAGGYTGLVLAGGRPDFKLGLAHCAQSNRDSAFCGWMGRGVRRHARAELGVVHDARIRAAVLMAPAWSVFFDRHGLADVAIPLRLYRAANDTMVRAATGEEHLLKTLPRPPEYVVIPGGDHNVFVAPCGQGMRGPACADAKGVDRVAIHRKMNADILDFFDRTLGKDP
ncbi:MAG: alpha/beta hydrolase family protein [Reyranellaceae bacterium]